MAMNFRDMKDAIGEGFMVVAGREMCLWLTAVGELTLESHDALKTENVFNLYFPSKDPTNT